MPAIRKRKTNDECLFVTIDYIVKKTGLSYSYIYGKLGQDNFIPCMRFGRSYRFLKKEVDEWIEALVLSRLPEKDLTAEQRRLVNRFKPFYRHR